MSFGWVNSLTLKLRFSSFALLALTFVALAVFPVSAQTSEPAQVRAIVFTSPLCTFCRQIVERDLPPAIAEFGSRLQILYVDITEPEGDQLYTAAVEAFGVQRSTPLLFIGENTLGGVNIVPKLPALVESYLAQGGVDWPAIPGLANYLAAAPATTTLTASPPAVVVAQAPALPPDVPWVGVILFWMESCSHCHEVIDSVLPPLQEKYGAQLQVWLVEVITPEDVARLYETATAYNIPPESAGVPLLLIGDRALLGDRQIPEKLPGLIEQTLAAGGAAYPDVAWPAEAQRLDGTPVVAAVDARPDGFELALGALGLMVAALLYTPAALLWTRLPAPSWRLAEITLPLLALAGLGVAGYLAYVKIQATPAACGPVGDCNAVQASPYARVFGILPLGVLGMLGYSLILSASWLRLGRGFITAPATWAVFSLSVFGVLFSIYLTYLEVFVIRAVCIWCISSAMIMTLVLLLALAMVRQVLKNKSASQHWQRIKVL